MSLIRRWGEAIALPHPTAYVEGTWRGVRKKLQIARYNKDKALIPTETGKYRYTWVDPSDPRYCETHTLVVDEICRGGGKKPKQERCVYSERADLPPQDDNLLVLGESGDVLEALTRVPELAEKYVGKVKLVYIDAYCSDWIQGSRPLCPPVETGFRYI